jgi:F-type H+-transporting ATPase subunit delta
MREKTVVTRYAEAYVSYALPQIGLPRVVEDMRVLDTLLRENPELENFLRAPDIPLEGKSEVLEKVLEGLLTETTQDFVKYLIVKGRIEHIRDIANHVRVVYSHGEVADVVLQTTFPLDLDLVERIKKTLARRTGKDVNLYLELTPELLGGIRIVIGNKVLDGSLRNRLDEMKKQLLKTQVVR